MTYFRVLVISCGSILKTLIFYKRGVVVDYVDDYIVISHGGSLSGAITIYRKRQLGIMYDSLCQKYGAGYILHCNYIAHLHLDK